MPLSKVYKFFICQIAFSIHLRFSRESITAVIYFILSKNYMYQSEWEVIIVGAGPSGIGAARTLQNLRIPYILLEARDRVGGRVYSEKIDGVQIDLGACWIHGYGAHNPLRKEVKRLGWKPCVLAKRSIGRRYIDGETGEKYEKEVWEPGDKRYEQFLSEVKTKAKTSKNDLSVFDAGKKYLEESSQKMNEIDKRYLTMIINMVQHYEGSSAQELSAKNYKYRTMFGRDYLPQKSYAALLSKIAQGLNIRLKTYVKAIKYDEKGVEVLTEDGKVFKSKKVVVGVPLGVLKKKFIEFHPKLPELHQRAIEKLGISLMNKIIISFSQNFWGDCRWISIGCNERGRYPHFYNFSRGNKHILCSFVTDDFARKIESFSDEEILEDLLELLNNVFKGKTIKINDYRITRWSKDQLSMGSYSAFHVGSSCEDSFQLRKNVKKTLWMVGQHCFAEHIGTAGGAYQTGVWAAQQIIDVLGVKVVEKQKGKREKKVEKKLWK